MQLVTQSNVRSLYFIAVTDIYQNLYSIPTPRTNQQLVCVNFYNLIVASKLRSVNNHEEMDNDSNCHNRHWTGNSNEQTFQTSIFVITSFVYTVFMLQGPGIVFELSISLQTSLLYPLYEVRPGDTMV